MTSADRSEQSLEIKAVDFEMAAKIVSYSNAISMRIVDDPNIVQPPVAKAAPERTNVDKKHREPVPEPKNFALCVTSRKLREATLYSQ